jgi:hypothetical protein
VVGKRSQHKRERTQKKNIFDATLLFNKLVRHIKVFSSLDHLRLIRNRKENESQYITHGFEAKESFLLTLLHDYCLDDEDQEIFLVCVIPFQINNRVVFESIV